MGLDNKEPDTSTFDASQSGRGFPSVPKPTTTPAQKDAASVYEAMTAEPPRELSQREMDKINELSKDTKDASKKSTNT